MSAAMQSLVKTTISMMYPHIAAGTEKKTLLFGVFAQHNFYSYQLKPGQKFALFACLVFKFGQCPGMTRSA